MKIDTSKIHFNVILEPDMGRKKKEDTPKRTKAYKEEFLPPVELKTDPDYPVLVVAGHKVTPREADIFYTYHTTHNAALVCKKFGMTPQNLWQMTTRGWWETWNLHQLKEWMNVSRNHWLSKADKLITKQLDYLDNPHDYPAGYGQALAKMMDTLFRMAPEGLQPTLVSKFEFEYKANVKETIDVNINITSDQIKKLSPEQIDDWNRTGVMPLELTEILNEKANIIDQAVDAEFEDVEDDDEIGDDDPDENKTGEKDEKSNFD